MNMAGGFTTYPGKLTGYVVVICTIVAAMGGLQKRSVRLLPSFLEEFFPSVYKKQKTNYKDDTSTHEYCKFESGTFIMFTSSFYLAALLSSFVASVVTRKLGRKLSMRFGGILLCAGALINEFSQAIWMHIVGYALGGFGVGFANQAVPLYLSEVAPQKYRGALNIGFQLSITIGLLFTNVFNYGFNQIHEGWGRRLSFGDALIPALIITIGSLFIPETPIYLIECGELDKARAKLEQIRGVKNVDEEFYGICAAGDESQRIEHAWRNLLQRKYRPQLTMAIVIPFFQQLTGINVIMFYAPLLFNIIGFGGDASLICAVVTGVVNVIATIISIYGVDKWGRKILFIQGGVQMLICQLVIAICIGVRFGVTGEPVDELPQWYAIAVLVSICIYVAGFAWSWGPLGWLVPSEIFPLEIRSAAQSINVSVNMLFTFLIPQMFLMMHCHWKFGLFLFFAFSVVMMTIFIYFFLPETKNIPIEKMVEVWKRHEFWSKFISDADYPNTSF